MKKILSIITAGLMLFTISFSFSSIAQAKQSSSGFQPVTLCHHTSSATNPYVTITVDNQGQLNGHEHHQGDIIPAPADGCPGKTHPTPPTPTPTLAPTPTPTPLGGGTVGKPKIKISPQVLGTTAPSAQPLPVTGADVNYSWIYYFLIIASLSFTYYMKAAGWKKFTR